MAKTEGVNTGPEAETREALQDDGAPEGPPGGPEGNPLVESILDNLPAWAFIALAVSALYMVWATLVIVGKYVGELPTFVP